MQNGPPSTSQLHFGSILREEHRRVTSFPTATGLNTFIQTSELKKLVELRPALRLPSFVNYSPSPFPSVLNSPV